MEEKKRWKKKRLNLYSKSFFIPKHAYDIFIEEDDNNCALTNYLQTATENGFSVKYSHESNLQKGSVIILSIPHWM